MNKRRETDLQRLSRIGNINDTDNPASDGGQVQQTGHPIAVMTIEAAIAIFLSGICDTIDWCFWQGGFLKTSHKATTEQFSREFTQKLIKALENDESARYQYRTYKHFYEPATDFDRLDAHREDGFLLYSYSKYGTHSTLGAEQDTGAYFMSEA